MDFNNYNSYDIVFDVKSLSNLKEGFPIIYSETLQEQYNKLIKKNIIVITAIGNSNKGKTFILSKICESNLPSGHITKGISIKYHPNFLKNEDSNKRYVKRYIILDIEGSEKGITISNEDKNELIN